MSSATDDLAIIIALEISARPEQVKAAISMLDNDPTQPLTGRFSDELDETQFRWIEERLPVLREETGEWTEVPKNSIDQPAAARVSHKRQRSSWGSLDQTLHSSAPTDRSTASRGVAERILKTFSTRQDRLTIDGGEEQAKIAEKAVSGWRIKQRKTGHGIRGTAKPSKFEPRPGRFGLDDRLEKPDQERSQLSHHQRPARAGTPLAWLDSVRRRTTSKTNLHSQRCIHRVFAGLAGGIAISAIVALAFLLASKGVSHSREARISEKSLEVSLPYSPAF